MAGVEKGSWRAHLDRSRPSLPVVIRLLYMSTKSPRTLPQFAACIVCVSVYSVRVSACASELVGDVQGINTQAISDKMFRKNGPFFFQRCFAPKRLIVVVVITGTEVCYALVHQV